MPLTEAPTWAVPMHSSRRRSDGTWASYGTRPTCAGSKLLGTAATGAVVSYGYTVNFAQGLFDPFTQFEDRLTQLDLRVARTFRVGGMQLQAQLDVYNAFNVSTVLFADTNYGVRRGNFNAKECETCGKHSCTLLRRSLVR